MHNAGLIIHNPTAVVTAPTTNKIDCIKSITHSPSLILQDKIAPLDMPHHDTLDAVP
jgi:hypothetical protein